MSEHTKLFSVTGEQVIEAVIRSAAVKADLPGVLVWTANASEQIEAALEEITNPKSP